MNGSLPPRPLHILLKEDNQHALTVLNRDYAEGLFRALRYEHYITNEADFDDIFNASLLRIWDLRATFASSADVVKMLFTVVKGKAIDRLRHLNTKAGKLLTGVEPDELVADNLVDNLPAQDMPLLQAKIRHYYDAIAQLTERQRTIIEALFLHGETVNDLAARLGIEPPTIRNTKKQALDSMARYLHQHHITPDMVDQLVRLLPILWLLLSTFFKNS